LQNTTAIKMQYVEIQKSADQSGIQSQAIQASEVHARKESFLRIADSVNAQLGVIAGFLYLSSQGSNAAGTVSAERLSDLWASMSRNDPDVFVRQMLEEGLVGKQRYAYKLFYGTLIRSRHAESFIFNFERLVRVALDSDPDEMIADALRGSPSGHLYLHMIEHRDNPPEGFTYGVFDFDPDDRDN
jgi:hypothetical protein